MKKIRKVYSGAVPNGKVLNSRNDSLQDTYSSDYLNRIIPDTQDLGEIVVDDISCKNKFNKYSILKGYELQSTDGSATANPDWFVSDYIEVEPNEIYSLSGNRTLGTTNAFYDANKNYLGYVSVLKGTITSLANTKYMRLNGRLNELENDIQLEKGPVATDYVEHKEFSNKQVYSTSEQVIGTWIDGKPLYRKTINIGNLPNTTTKDYPTGLSNIFVIKIDGFCTDGTQMFPMNNANPSSINYQIQLWFAYGDSVIKVQTGSDRSGYIGYVTLEYTKTTD